MITSSQKQAIEFREGQLLVIAGPGSGKTFVITERIKYLIENLGISPEHILVVTFSKAAALEMEGRFKKKSDAKDVTFGTFHSVFYSILKYAYGWKAEDYIIEEDPYTGMVDIVRFEEMLKLTEELLKARDDIRSLFRKKYSWILVDEFQDINPLQFDILKLLTGKDGNLTIVGDDDQSIYKFRGSEPAIMLAFQKHFPKSQKVVLDVNFRSCPEIVMAATRLITHNRKRYKKRIHAFRTETGSVTVNICKDIRDELVLVCNDITKRNIEEHKDVVILYRTNQQGDMVSDILKEYKMNITHMTFHKSKGLEYKYVYIIDVNEGITPFKKKGESSDTEEERRMMYVAMTRAKNELAIYYCKTRKLKNVKPSRYIKEINS